MKVHYPDYGTPVQHRGKRRPKLAPGYSYDSRGCVISPNGQLMFARKEGRKTVWVEGRFVRLYDNVAKLERSVRAALRRMRRKAR